MVEYFMLRAVGASGIVLESNVYGSTVLRQPTSGGSNRSRNSGRSQQTAAPKGPQSHL
jgi:hypothetical protein